MHERIILDIIVQAAGNQEIIERIIESLRSRLVI